MSRWLMRLLIVLSVLPLPSAAFSASRLADYRIRSGDQLTITVFGQPELSGDLSVDGSGAVRLPLIGKVKVSDLTLEECRLRLTERLADGYLASPAVDVSVKQWRPVFVLGDVRLPGAIAFQPGLSVYSAVALAGGFLRAEANPGAALAEYLAAEERVESLLETKLLLAVRLARYEAQRDGKRVFEVPVDASQRATLSAVIQNEKAYFAADLSALQTELDLLRRQLPRIAAEKLALESQLAAEKKQIDLASTRVANLAQMTARGSVNASTAQEARRDEARIESNIARLNADLVRLDMNVGEYELRIAERRHAFQRKALGEIRDIRMRLLETETSLHAALRIRDLRKQSATAASTLQDGDLGRTFVLRREHSQSVPKTVTEDVALEPGDLLEVRILMPRVQQSATTLVPPTDRPVVAAGPVGVVRP